MASNKTLSSPQILCFAPDSPDMAELSKLRQRWLKDNGFNGQKGRLLALPDEDGAIAAYAFGLGAPANEAFEQTPLLLGEAAAKLPAGNYRISENSGRPELAQLAFALGAYRFNPYRTAPVPDRECGDVTLQLQADENADHANMDEIANLVKAAFIARDLINTPANDLGPDAFEARVRAFAQERKMSCSAIVGDDLLEQNFPMIHAVGRASSEAPRLLDLRWGNPDAPKVTLVGKGVVFDTGGLNIKHAAGMVLMKKDMGGAANILGLSHAIVAAKLNVRLRVLLPIVENAISGNAFRPGDILPSRAGLRVEIGNTDAEGRLILADALACASEEEPDLLLDMATLTGAARVALGPDLPPVYSPNGQLAQQLVDLGNKWGDPLWHMPLWSPYHANLASSVADINHISSGGFAGSVIAALFLQRFVGQVKDWVHMDIYGWMPKAQPGRSQGGTDQGIRAAYMMLKKRYG